MVSCHVKTLLRFFPRAFLSPAQSESPGNARARAPCLVFDKSLHDDLLRDIPDAQHPIRNALVEIRASESESEIVRQLFIFRALSRDKRPLAVLFPSSR
jgi:hypothetical protein